jgi:hypothetical protein
MVHEQHDAHVALYGVYRHVRNAIELATDWLVGERKETAVERLRERDFGNMLWEAFRKKYQRPDLGAEVNVAECEDQPGLYHIGVVFHNVPLPEGKMIVSRPCEHCGGPGESMIVDCPVVMKFKVDL